MTVNVTIWILKSIRGYKQDVIEDIFYNCTCDKISILNNIRRTNYLEVIQDVIYSFTRDIILYSIQGSNFYEVIGDSYRYKKLEIKVLDV